jgi:hypothetical protein
VSWKNVLIAAALTFGAANVTTHTAFGRGMSGGAHFVGGGFSGRNFANGRSFARPLRRNFAFRNAFGTTLATGGLWPDYYGYYDYAPTDVYGGTGTATYPATVGFVPVPMPVPACHRSEETVKVPSESGGTSEIKITRCP